MREFKFAVYVTRRGHSDDATLQRGQYVAADEWTELRGARLVPGETDAEDVPAWEAGGWLADRHGRPIPGWNFAGRPPEFLIRAWEDDREIDGIVIAGSARKTTGED